MSNRWSAFVALSVLVLCPLAQAVAAADTPDRTPNAMLDAENAGRPHRSLPSRPPSRQGRPTRPLADDAQFIRRLYLDLAGCIPAMNDVRDFLDDTRPHKRRLWIDMLLDGKKPSRKADAFPQHFANVWRTWILSRVNNARTTGLAAATEAWLQERLKDNTPYDRLIRQMITASPLNTNDITSPGFFYQANEFEPEFFLNH